MSRPHGILLTATAAGAGALEDEDAAVDELETVERSSSGSSTKLMNDLARMLRQLDFVADDTLRSGRETLRPAFDAGDFACIGEYVAFGVVHEGGEPWERRPELIGDLAPTRLGGAFVLPQRLRPLMSALHT